MNLDLDPLGWIKRYPHKPEGLSKLPEEPASVESAVFQGSFAEKKLHSLAEKIDSEGWLTGEYMPGTYTKRTLGHTSVSFIKNKMTKPFVVQKVFDKEARDKVGNIYNGISYKNLLKQKGLEKKLETFLKLPLFASQEYVVLKGEICLCKVLAQALQKTNRNSIFLKGGIARYLAIPWVEETLQQRLDKNLQISPIRKKILNGDDRPDWDFREDSGDPTIFEDLISEELLQAIFGDQFDPDYKLFYMMIIKKIILNSGGQDTGQERSTNLSFGDGHKNKVDITHHQVLRHSQLFEFNGFEITIPKHTLVRWSKNLGENVTSKDVEEILLDTQRVKNDDGLQCALDLAYGLLHTKNFSEQNQAIFSRYIYWISFHSLSYETHFRRNCLSLLITYQKRGIALLNHNEAANLLAKSIMYCHENHNMGNVKALKSMIVNTVITLVEEQIPSAENICHDFLKNILPQVPATKDNDDLFSIILANQYSIPQLLDALRLFALIKAASVNNSSEIHVNLTLDGRQLQIIDGNACVVRFEIKNLLKNIEDIPFKHFAPLFEKIFGNITFDSSEPNQLHRLSNMPWQDFERMAFQFINSEENTSQKLGYLMLLASQAANPTFVAYRPLITHCTKIMMEYAGEHREIFRRNFETAIRQSTYEDAFSTCFDGIELSQLEDSTAIDEKMAIAFAPWDTSTALNKFDQLDSDSKIDFGKKLIDKLRFSSSRAALNVLLKIGLNHFSRQEKIELITSFLINYRLDEVSLIQKALTSIIEDQETEPVQPEKRKNHGKRHVSTQPEPISLMKCRGNISQLVFDGLQICPDEAALNLFALAARDKLLDTTKAPKDCLAMVYKHCQGGKNALLKLWKACIDYQIDLPQSQENPVALVLCEDLFEDTDESIVELVRHLSTNLWANYEFNPHQDRLSELLKRRLDHLALEKNSVELNDFLNSYAHLLEPTTLLIYRQALYALYLEQSNLSGAFEQLIWIDQEGFVEENLDAFLAIISESLSNGTVIQQNQIKTFLEKLVALALSKRAGFKVEQWRFLLKMIAKLFNNPAWENQAPGKAIRETVKSACPDIFAQINHSSQLNEEASLFLIALKHRQISVECQPKIIIKVCRHVLDKGSIGDRENIETAYQLLNFFKLPTLTNRQDHILLYENLIGGMLYAGISELKWNQRTFERILYCLEYSAQNAVQVITLPLFLRCIDYFAENKDLDAEILLDAAAKCPYLHSSEIFRTCLIYLSTRLTHLERSSRLLLELCPTNKKNPIVFRGAKKIIQEIIRSPKAECLKNAFLCLFNYEICDETLATDLFKCVSLTNDEQLIDDLWIAFNNLYHTSFETAFVGRCFYEIVMLIAVTQHPRIDDVFSRFLEFYTFSLKAQLNPQDVLYLRAFKEHLLFHYPEFHTEINRFNFADLLDLVFKRPVSLTNADDQTLDVNQVQRHFFQNTNTPLKSPAFYLSNQLYLRVMRGYAERAFCPINPRVLSLSSENLSIMRAGVCHNLSVFRFSNQFPTLIDRTLEFIDITIIELMIKSGMNEAASAYLEKTLESKSHDLAAFRQIIIHFIDFIDDTEADYKVLSTLIAQVRKNLDVGVICVLDLFQKHLWYRKVIIDCFNLLEDYIYAPTTLPPTDKSHSKLFKKICEAQIGLNEKLTNVRAFLETKLAHYWLTEQDCAEIWSIFFCQRLTYVAMTIIPPAVTNFEFGLAATLPNRSSSSPFPQGEGLPRSEREASIGLCLAESKFKVCDRGGYKLSYQQLPSLLDNFFAKKAIMMKSDQAIIHVFEHLISIFMTEIERKINCIPDELIPAQIAKMHQEYTELCLRLLKEFTEFQDCSFSTPLTINAYNAAATHLIEVGLDDSTGVVFEPTFKNCLADMLKLLSTTSHEEMQRKIKEKYSNFNVSFNLTFKTEQHKHLYFLLSKSLIKYLTVRNNYYDVHKVLLIHYAEFHSQFLIANYSDRLEDLLKFLHLMIFTSPNIQHDYSMRINRYVFIKTLLTYPIIVSKFPDFFYEIYIYLFSDPIEFNTSIDQLESHNEIIKGLIKLNAPHLTARAIEMLNEIPESLLINDDNATKVYTLINNLLNNFNNYPIQTIYTKPYATKNVSIYELFKEMLLNNPLLSAKSGTSSQDRLKQNAKIAENFLAITINHYEKIYEEEDRGTKLLKTYYRFYKMGCFDSDMKIFANLVTPLFKCIYSEIITLNQDQTDATIDNSKLFVLDVCDLVIDIPNWKNSEKDVVKSLSSYLFRIFEALELHWDQSIADFLQKTTLKAIDRFHMETEHEDLHKSLIRRFKKILQPHKLATPVTKKS